MGCIAGKSVCKVYGGPGAAEQVRERHAEPWQPPINQLLGLRFYYFLRPSALRLRGPAERMIAMSRRPGRTARLLACTALMGCVAITAAGCVTPGARDTTGSIAATGSPRTDADWRRESEAQGERYRANPNDAGAALAYGRSLQ